MEYFKNDTIELINKTETDLEINLWLPEGEGGRGRFRIWDRHAPTAVFKKDNQQGHTIKKLN